MTRTSLFIGLQTFATAPDFPKRAVGIGKQSNLYKWSSTRSVAYRSQRKSVSSLIVNSIPNLSIASTTDGHAMLPLLHIRRRRLATAARTSPTGRSTDSAPTTTTPTSAKWDIFYYVYGLLHHPGYRERYALDLKRNLPRIPFAPTPSPGPFPEASGKRGTVASAKSLPEASGRDLGWGWQKGGFWPFSRAGQQLADLHLNYESVDRYQLDWQAERTPPSYRVEKMLPRGKTDSEPGNYKVYELAQIQRQLDPARHPRKNFRLSPRQPLRPRLDRRPIPRQDRQAQRHQARSQRH